MPSGGKPTARSRRLGSTLRQLRLSAGLDQEQAAQAVDCSTAKISRIESGTVKARLGDLRILLDLYEVADQDRRDRLERLARDSSKKGWWLDYDTSSLTHLGDVVSMEADATSIQTWQHAFLPGLLQTPAYTRALLAANPTPLSPEAADEVVQVRQARQAVLRENGTEFAAVIWEPAITTPMSSPHDRQDQLTHLLRTADQQTITVQVLPFSQWGAAMAAPPFIAYSFGRDHSPEVVATDTVSNTIMVEDSDEIANYDQAFSTLRSAALSPQETKRFITQQMDQLLQGDTSR
ncbi:helix-turn-helix transcriptional regulator [Streptomyces sodiiphilus]|uniref:Helix-turn-helix transcriptional regulator n=1 Tax=Streptomyces sodiiphilus TaxID=226217 RepID=A0ABN2P3F9_9ACTN